MNKLFVLLVVYQLKHFLADYPLQTKYMLGKFLKTGWIKPLLAHAGVHGLFTFWIASTYIFLIQNATGEGIFIGALPAKLALFDTIIHFTMDRIKASPGLLGRFKPLDGYLWKMHSDNMKYKGIEGLEATYDNSKKQLRSNVFFWWSLGLDQMVHHLTHYAVIYALVS